MFYNNQFIPSNLWSNGPAPGQFYNFSGGALTGEAALRKSNPEYLAPGQFGTQHSFTPVTTATTVLGIKFDKGVMIAADNLVSYGSLARYQDVQRVFKINDRTIIGASGDFADFQSLQRSIEQKTIEDKYYDDGIVMGPKATYTWLTRIMYNRRSRMNPLWLDIVVAGMENGEPFLGHVDARGRAYVDDTVATGFGKHLALPIVREHLDRENKKLTQSEASTVLRKCMEVLYYRDCRTINKYTVAVSTSHGAVVQGPFKVSENWSMAPLIKGYD